MLPAAVADPSVPPVRLLAEPLTPAAFAPYGSVVAAPAATGTAINGGSSERFELASDLRLHADGGRPVLALFRARPHALPVRLVAMERHALGSQTFVPLGDHRFVVVVAPAGAPPGVSDLRAFVTEARQGIVIAPGTWHHPLLALDGGDFVVIERAAAQVDCDIIAVTEPVEVVLSP
jgi:ureidoglycolate lyase